MHIIIPMSGLGTRFLAAGYEIPKPLIRVEEKPIIEHVCELFPNETKFTFIINESHLEKINMVEILKKIRPKSQVIGIKSHKLGPVYAVSKVFDLIDDHEEVIINYCDFGTYWNYSDFLQHTRSRNADGAIPAYKGFHPHMLGPNNYAFIRENAQWLRAIQEKKPFTDNRSEEYASNGTYYFRQGRLVKKYFQLLMDKGEDLNGEYYVSMIYNLLVQDNLKVSIYNIQHMLQWGTPEDLKEYQNWSNYFRNIIHSSKTYPSIELKDHINLIPMAGHGSRFSKVGYTLPKPLISISGKPMVIQAIDALPIKGNNRFICLNEHLQKYPLKKALNKFYPHSTIIALDQITKGQAISCQMGLNDLSHHTSIMIGACDNSMVINKEKFEKVLTDENVDGIVFTFKNHSSVKRNPHMYGYVEVNDDNVITKVSVKVPISDMPTDDHAIVGSFFLKNKSLFDIGLKELINKQVLVNNEFYMDSLIGELASLSYRIKPFVVDHYICWGTPDDLKTFLYWQSFFHKVHWHPYRLEKDPTVHPSVIHELERSFTDFSQEYT